MTHILRIDSSSRTTGSHSRKLSDILVSKLSALHPGATTSVRDLAQDPIEHIRDVTIQGYYTPPSELSPELKQATALSDTLIEELRSADIITIGAPIYNFSVPSALKAYIDQIVRINKTFSYDGTGFGPLLPSGKTAYIIAVYGGAGYAEGEAFAAANFLEPYLKFVLNFIGVTDVRAITMQGTSGDEAAVSSALVGAKGQIAAL